MGHIQSGSRKARIYNGLIASLIYVFLDFQHALDISYTLLFDSALSYFTFEIISYLLLYSSVFLYLISTLDLTFPQIRYPVTISVHST